MGRRRLAAIMFTDMVGYTALGQKNESLSLALVEEQRQLVRLALARHNGREVKTMGDAFLVEFSSALDAVRCAYDIQRAAREFNISLPEDRRVHLRIGVHLGDVVGSGEDISGDAVNVASRKDSVAEDGGVCLTRQVYDQVRNKFDIPLQSMGTRTLKNLETPLEIFRLLMPWSKESPSSILVDRKRIAVLPFTNISPDPSDEYFADGMTEEVTSTLSTVSGLTVISRTSAMRYKGAKKSLGEIGRELGVGTLMEGSVRKAGNNVRITVQLLDASEDKHIWAQKYDRKLEDVFAVQSDIASSVAEVLRVKILEPEAMRVAKKPTESIEAYTLYLKGRQAWNRRSKDEVEEAMRCFNLASKIDPGFALAYVGMADCFTTMGDWGYAPTAEMAPKVKQSVLKALKLDDGLAEGHATYALMLALNEWRWDEAELEFKRAIELNPNYATTHQWYSYSVLRFARRVDEEMREAEKALELDPLAPVMSFNKGQSLFFQERYDEAIEYSKRALAIDPNFLIAYVLEAASHLMSGRHLEAISLMETYLPLLGIAENRQKVSLASYYAEAGRDADARRLVAEVTANGDKSVPPTEFAWAYLGLGESEKMFEFLELAFVERDANLPWTLTDPGMKPLRSDLRLQELKRKVGI